MKPQEKRNLWMVAAPFDILPGIFVLSLLRAARVRKLFAAWQETLLLSVICVAQLLLPLLRTALYHFQR